jgi:hypothetical protein
MDRPVSTQDLAAVFTDILGRDIIVRGLPWPLLNLLARPVGMFSERVSDMRAMIEYSTPASTSRTRRRRRRSSARSLRSRTHCAVTPPTLVSWRPLGDPVADGEHGLPLVVT